MYHVQRVALSQDVDQIQRFLSIFRCSHPRTAQERTPWHLRKEPTCQARLDDYGALYKSSGIVTVAFAISSRVEAGMVLQVSRQPR